MPNAFHGKTFDLKVDDVAIRVSAILRDGPLAPIVFLHGFGSTKEDYADIVRHDAFAGHPFLAYDAPGCGQTECADLERISIPFLEQTALAMLKQVGFERYHLVGHSMGGLTALMLAHAAPGRILSFVDIEGNIAPEDCFLSRQIVDFPADTAEQFLATFIDRTYVAPAYGSALYAASLRHKVRAGAVAGIFRSMVALSDHGALMEKFLALPCPTMFMYGAENGSLSYLQTLAARGVELAEIADCGHFPMYSNPAAMWREIARLQAAASA